jgi:hypothetical protein
MDSMPMGRTPGFVKEPKKRCWDGKMCDDYRVQGGLAAGTDRGLEN